MGFEAWAVPAADAPSRGTPVPAATLTRHPPPAREMPHTFLLDPRDEGAYLDVFALLREGVPVERIATPISGLPPGAFLVRGLAGTRCRYAKPLTFDGAASGRPVASPRIGVFWSWTANMDEGWTRFFFDDLGIPFIPVRPADVLAGNLSRRIDVLVIADVSARNLTRGPQDGKLPDVYGGGLGTQGLDHLRAFVKGGGTVVTLNDSSDLLIQAFDLPLQRMSTRRGRRSNDDEGGSATRTYIPGSVVRSLVDTAHPLGYGSPTTTPVFLREARPLEVRASDEEVRVSLPVRYATEDLVAGGFAEGAEVLHGKAAAAVVEVGEGTLVLFAFSPQFRCQTWSTFRLFLNSLFL
jgi:hypothetical protein